MGPMTGTGPQREDNADRPLSTTPLGRLFPPRSTTPPVLAPRESRGGLSPKERRGVSPPSEAKTDPDAEVSCSLLIRRSTSVVQP
jgi:hypothetical protein